MIKAIAVFAGLALLSFGANAQQHQARGVLVAEQMATLSSELTSSVVKLPYALGQSFKKGRALVQLDCSVFRAQVQKILAEREAAKIKVDNVTKLSQLKSVGKLEVALAQAELKKIEAELNIARINTRRCAINAPFDGRVSKLHVKRYEAVEQQQAVIDIVGSAQLRVDVIVPAAWVKWLSKGQPVFIVIDETGDKVEGKISHLGPNIDHTSQTLRIQAKIVSKNSALLPGMSAMVSFTPNNQNS